MDPYSELIKVLNPENEQKEIFFVSKVLGTSPFTISVEDLKVDENIFINADIEFFEGDIVLTSAKSDLSQFFVICRLKEQEDV